MNLKDFLLKKRKTSKRGFALLFSVLVSSLLLSIGLSIFNIALKELAISTAARQSIIAFYAADSGREYALYHDLKVGDLLIFDTTIDYPHEQNFITPQQISVDDSDVSNNPNFIIEIEKSWKDAGKDKILVDIKSRGYDLPEGNSRLERAINQSY